MPCHAGHGCIAFHTSTPSPAHLQEARLLVRRQRVHQRLRLLPGQHADGDLGHARRRWNAAHGGSRLLVPRLHDVLRRGRDGWARRARARGAVAVRNAVGVPRHAVHALLAHRGAVRVRLLRVLNHSAKQRGTDMRWLMRGQGSGQNDRNRSCSTRTNTARYKNATTTPIAALTPANNTPRQATARRLEGAESN